MEESRAYLNVHARDKALMPDIFHIRDLLKHCHFNTFVLLDLDNTTMESIQELGSDQWFYAFVAYVCQFISNKEEADALVHELYDALQSLIDVNPVEKNIVRIINYLQEIGIPIIAVTARGESILDSTVRQLKSINVEFDKQWPGVSLELGQYIRRVVFEHGIIFCNNNEKDICVKLFFEWLGYLPKDVIMIDDKEKHLTAMEKTFSKLTHFTGLRYTFLDGKVKAFNLDKAMQQLTAIRDLLPDNVRNNLQKIPLNHPSIAFFSPSKNNRSDVENENHFKLSL